MLTAILPIRIVAATSQRKRIQGAGFVSHTNDMALPISHHIGAEIPVSGIDRRDERGSRVCDACNMRI
jgi:hypothetical protein